MGIEAEKFVVDEATGRPICYEGKGCIEGMFAHLVAKRAWKPISEVPGGPVVSLSQGARSITLEPAAQFELSGSPFASLHDVNAELAGHTAELRELEAKFGVRFLHLGFHPWASHADLPWVPKRRYPIMKDYLPKQGSRGLDMMRRTATVQANLDYGNENDAMSKLVTLLRLTPVLQSMFLNSPWLEERPSGRLSERLDVWLNMDPTRSGLLTHLWDKPAPRYSDYVEWALDAGMFLIIRDGKAVANTGQTFRSFLKDGFQGHRATLKDWQLHLGTLFPEVRLKTTLEMRGADCVPPVLAMALPALLKGLMYDETALSQAQEVAVRVDPETAVALQREISFRGLAASLRGEPIQMAALQLFDIAESSLRRNAVANEQGEDEAIYLGPLRELVVQGVTPAEQLRATHAASGRELRPFLIETSRAAH